MKHIKISLIVSLLCPVFTGFSQHVVLHETNADRRYEIPKDGANRRQYHWFQLTLLGTDLAFGELHSKQDFSNYYAMSWNHQFRLNGAFSHGLGYGVHRQVYRLSEKGLNIVLHGDCDKGKLIYWGVNANYFWRFNFDPRRGSTIGRYLDLAAFGQFNFYQYGKFVQGRLTEKTGSTNCTERCAIGAEVRLGYEIWSMYARYKFFVSSPESGGTFADMELARWSVGLNLGLGS